MNIAPIVLFAYNRPWHLAQTIDALKKNELSVSSDLIVFSDGAKNHESNQKVEEVRQYLKTISGFKSVKVVERDRNLGLARSIISGVSQVVGEYDRVIVMEDDLVTSPFFLHYMNDALEYYADEDEVISIHGYCYPVRGTLPETFFIKGADCLGWGTWQRGWSLFEENSQKLLERLKQKDLLLRFDFFGAYGYTKMLKNQIKGKNDSWAVRWYASALLNDKLTLYPGQSLVFHIGYDGSGTNCGVDNCLDVALCERQLLIGTAEVAENMTAVEQFRHFFISIRPNCRMKIKKIGGRAKKYLHKFNFRH